MFIGSLNWDTTDGRYSVLFILEYWCSWLKIILYVDALREYFPQFGKEDACTIMRDTAGSSKYFAFLAFEESASVNAVMVREHFLDGKIMSSSFPPFLTHKKLSSILRSTRKEPSRGKNTNARRSSSSVDWRAASCPRACASFFPQFGKVIDLTVMLDHETGWSKGFGFVSFEDTNVQPFLGFGNLEIDGKLVCIPLLLLLSFTWRDH
jgi:RNA-binding protein Musashi